MKHFKYFFSIIVMSLLLLSSCDDFVTERELGKAKTDSYSFTVQPYQWIEMGQPETALYGYSVKINVPEITQDVLDNGLVMVYMKMDNEYAALPFTFTFDGYQTIFEYTLQLNIVNIYLFDTDLQTLDPTGPITFKVVIINDFGAIGMSEEVIKDMEYEDVLLLNQND